MIHWLTDWFINWHNKRESKKRTRQITSAIKNSTIQSRILHQWKQAPADKRNFKQITTAVWPDEIVPTVTTCFASVFLRCYRRCALSVIQWFFSVQLMRSNFYQLTKWRLSSDSRHQRLTETQPNAKGRRKQTVVVGIVCLFAVWKKTAEIFAEIFLIWKAALGPYIVSLFTNRNRNVDSRGVHVLDVTLLSRIGINYSVVPGIAML